MDCFLLSLLPAPVTHMSLFLYSIQSHLLPFPMGLPPLIPTTTTGSLRWLCLLGWISVGVAVLLLQGRCERGGASAERRPRQPRRIQATCGAESQQRMDRCVNSEERCRIAKVHLNIVHSLGSTTVQASSTLFRRVSYQRNCLAVRNEMIISCLFSFSAFGLGSFFKGFAGASPSKPAPSPEAKAKLPVVAALKGGIT